MRALFATALCVIWAGVAHATLPVGSFAGHMSLDEVNQFFSSLSTQYPSHAQPSMTIGASVEGRDIQATCIGACGRDNSAKFLVTSMHHAREPMSMTVAAYFVDKVLSEAAGGNEEFIALLNTREMWFVPVVNPDAYEFNFQSHPTGGGLARKNRRPGCHSGDLEEQFGVDLNRNYDYLWDVDNAGSRPGVCFDDYRGTAPFSEPETQAIRDFTAQHDFAVALNFHSYGDFVNIPFATNKGPTHGELPPNDRRIYHSLVADMTQVNHFRSGHAWAESSLYTVNGEASDWMYATHHTFAMSPEVGPSLDDPAGFWPLQQDIPRLAAQLFDLQREAAWASGPRVALSDVQLVVVEPSDDTGCTSVEVTFTVENRAVMNTSHVTVALSNRIEGLRAPQRRRALRGRTRPRVRRRLEGSEPAAAVFELDFLEPYGSEDSRVGGLVCTSLSEPVYLVAFSSLTTEVVTMLDGVTQTTVLESGCGVAAQLQERLEHGQLLDSSAAPPSVATSPSSASNMLSASASSISSSVSSGSGSSPASSSFGVTSSSSSSTAASSALSSASTGATPSDIDGHLTDTGDGAAKVDGSSDGCVPPTCLPVQQGTPNAEGASWLMSAGTAVIVCVVLLLFVLLYAKVTGRLGGSRVQFHSLPRVGDDTDSELDDTAGDPSTATTPSVRRSRTSSSRQPQQVEMTHTVADDDVLSDSSGNDSEGSLDEP